MRSIPLPWRSRGLALGLIASLLAAACAAPAAPAQPAAPAAPAAAPAPGNATQPAAAAPAQPAGAAAHVRVATIGSLSDSGLFIALERGYWQEQGLNVELVPFDNIGLMVPAMGTGQVEVGAGSTAPGLFNAVRRDVPLKIVADKGNAARASASARSFSARTSPTAAPSATSPTCAARPSPWWASTSRPTPRCTTASSRPACPIAR